MYLSSILVSCTLSEPNSTIFPYVCPDWPLGFSVRSNVLKERTAKEREKMSVEYLRSRIHALEVRRETDPNFSFADSELLKNFHTRLRQAKQSAKSPTRRRNKNSNRRRNNSRNRNRSNNRRRNTAPRSPPLAPNSFVYHDYFRPNPRLQSNVDPLPPVDAFLPERAQANADSAWLRSYFDSLERAISAK